jgi:sugar phosphate isomerase/epimerase
MVATTSRVGGFLHSYAIYSQEIKYKEGAEGGDDAKVGEDNLFDAIRTARLSGIDLFQIGPVSELYLGERGAGKRAELVDLLKQTNTSIGPVCVCYESKQAKRGGLEKYDDIDTIAETGGYGIDDKTILEERVALTREHVDFVRYLYDQGVGSSKKAVLTTHVGFFDRPEKREQIKEAVCEVVKYCQEKDVYFAIETGSEKMQELVGFIREVERETGIEGRLGINYDPANFGLYGTQDPLEALGVLRNGDEKNLLFGVHIKDAEVVELPGKAKGDWKGSGMDVLVGSGSVDWNKTLRLLHELGYNGPLIVERENPQPEGIGAREHTYRRTEDILHAKRNTEAVLKRIFGSGSGVPFSE